MRRLLVPPVILASAALATASVVGFVRGPDAPEPVSTEPGEVAIAAFAYGPDAIEVPVGATITWSNLDGAAHTVTSEDDGPLDSGSLEEGGSYEMTFDAPGTYRYVCSFHATMRGTVEVTPS